MNRAGNHAGIDEKDLTAKTSADVKGFLDRVAHDDRSNMVSVEQGVGLSSAVLIGPFVIAAIPERTGLAQTEPLAQGQERCELFLLLRGGGFVGLSPSCKNGFDDSNGLLKRKKRKHQFAVKEISKGIIPFANFGANARVNLIDALSRLVGSNSAVKEQNRIEFRQGMVLAYPVAVDTLAAKSDALFNKACRMLVHPFLLGDAKQGILGFAKNLGVGFQPFQILLIRSLAE